MYFGLPVTLPFTTMGNLELLGQKQVNTVYN